MPRQFGGLVEASPVVSREVQRNRHEEVGAIQNRGACLGHQSRERPCDRAALVVFEDVQNVPQHSLVCTNRTTGCDQAWMVRASRAETGAGVNSPCRKRVTADPAERLRQPMYAGPTAGADS